jgi:hypothetical protein
MPMRIYRPSGKFWDIPFLNNRWKKIWDEGEPATLHVECVGRDGNKPDAVWTYSDGEGGTWGVAVCAEHAAEHADCEGPLEDCVMMIKFQSDREDYDDGDV